MRHHRPSLRRWWKVGEEAESWFRFFIVFLVVHPHLCKTTDDVMIIIVVVVVMRRRYSDGLRSLIDWW